ncbi:phage Gp37/Gp68 family protein [Paraburkholderia caribensis]|uniref:phage Gp37/Gp68 family protein n=1 Tax=Paraburkholderia caribensis TaxID=75105 RepID=UPI001CAD6C5A|nr:phage Gp37/Gp68 family protein [Paraburkholderia caribensis]CAG9256080.1 Phage Gp37/Gp68 family protein [Paraburkholderia caribensis]
MSENSKIEWTDHTFNPWTGCTKVSPGCDHCYAEAMMDTRLHQVQWGPGQPRRRTSAANWRKPLQWNARPFFECPDCDWRGAAVASVNGIPACPNVSCASLDLRRTRPRVFCASLADVFDTDVDPSWRRDLFDLIELTPNLNWLLLTKRIGNAFREISRARSHDWLMGRDNVWLGATVVNQAEAERDIPKLLQVPARVRFLSMEPLLGPVRLDRLQISDEHELDVLRGRTGSTAQHLALRPKTGDRVDWVIVGGESGNGARPMHPDWPHSLRDQCAAAGVPFLFKQWGEWKPISEMTDGECTPLYRSNRRAREDRDQAVLDDLYGRTRTVDEVCLRVDGNHVPMYSPNAFLAGTQPMQAFRVGKKAAGRMLDGHTHDAFPRGVA